MRGNFFRTIAGILILVFAGCVDPGTSRVSLEEVLFPLESGKAVSVADHTGSLNEADTFESTDAVDSNESTGIRGVTQLGLAAKKLFRGQNLVHSGGRIPSVEPPQRGPNRDTHLESEDAFDHLPTIVHAVDPQPDYSGTPRQQLVSSRRSIPRAPRAAGNFQANPVSHSGQTDEMTSVIAATGFEQPSRDEAAWENDTSSENATLREDASHQPESTPESSQFEPARPRPQPAVLSVIASEQRRRAQLHDELPNVRPQIIRNPFLNPLPQFGPEPQLPEAEPKQALAGIPSQRDGNDPWGATQPTPSDPGAGFGANAPGPIAASPNLARNQLDHRGATTPAPADPVRSAFQPHAGEVQPNVPTPAEPTPAVAHSVVTPQADRWESAADSTAPPATSPVPAEPLEVQRPIVLRAVPMERKMTAWTQDTGNWTIPADTQLPPNELRELGTPTVQVSPFHSASWQRQRLYPGSASAAKTSPSERVNQGILLRDLPRMMEHPAMPQTPSPFLLPRALTHPTLDRNSAHTERMIKELPIRLKAIPQPTASHTGPVGHQGSEAKIRYIESNRPAIDSNGTGVKAPIEPIHELGPIRPLPKIEFESHGLEIRSLGQRHSDTTSR